MLSNFFSKSKPITYITLFILFLIYFILASLSNKLTVFFIDKSVLWYASCLLLMLLSFFFFNFIVTKNNLTFDNTYAFMFFILFLGILPITFSSPKILFINLSLLLFLRKGYSLQSSKKLIQKLFDTGLWLGINFLLEPYIAVFIIFIYVGIYSYQKLNFQTVVIPIIGWLTPVFLYFSYCFWYDKLALFYNLFYWTSSYNFSIYNSFIFIVPLILVTIFLIPSLIFKSSLLSGVKNKFKKSWYMVLLNLILAIVVVLLVNNKTGSEWLYTFFPITIIFANGLELVNKNWVKNLIISIFLVYSVILYIVGYIL